MSKFTITLTDESKRSMLKTLFETLDFIQYEEENGENNDYTAFEQSFGMWRGSDIDGESIRSQAWKRPA